MNVLAFGFGGPTDVAIICLVVLVLFGGPKLGLWGKNAGEGIKNFKKAVREDDPVPLEPENKPAASTTTAGTSEEK